MIDLTKYKNQKVYIELEKKTDDTDPEEEDKVQGGVIYKSLEEVMEVASEDDEFIEIEISSQYKAVNQCLGIVQIVDGKVVKKISL